MKNMKKLITLLMLAVLVVPALSLAEQDDAWGEPRVLSASKSGNRSINMFRKLSRTVTGRIESVSTDSVTITTEPKEKDEQKEVQVRIHEKYADEFTELLSQGLGEQAQLICLGRDADKPMLYKIKSIEGVDVSGQPNINAEIKERLRERLHSVDGRRPQPGMMQPGMGQPGMMQPGQRGPGQSGPAGMGKSKGGFGLHQNPELRKLERETQVLAKKYGQAQDREKDKLETELRDKLSETFDKKLELQAEEVERLEKLLEKFRQRLETRRKNRKVIIQKRFEQITEQEDDLVW